MNKSVTTFIGLGSNLDNPAKQIETALAELQTLPQSNLVKSSSLYKSAPMGPQDQPDFVNAVAKLETELDPKTLLHALQVIETKHGRERMTHWGPRTLDLDILLYGNLIMSTELLTLPHPGLYDREFVLHPLKEIAPNLILPNKIGLTQNSKVEAKNIFDEGV